jgi:hypothetical protein
MSALISAPSASGDILIEVDGPGNRGPITRRSGVETIQKAAASFEDSWTRIRPGRYPDSKTARRRHRRN